MTVEFVKTSIEHRISLRPIVAEAQGFERVGRRIRELRATGLDFAANAIEQEMATLGLLDGSAAVARGCASANERGLAD
ncbi:hypothetical protein ACFYO1_02115 [Nocardia sp. NPDC006044]|uniref:hypothetical protein n=1 Tax=Nocardia sp. NPDC006044 TaxID=3364306 RepID=UPI0036CC4192